VSVEQMTRVFRFSRSKGTARLVLLALADVANNDGEVTAYARSHRKLAGMANCDTGSVSRAIAKLADLGELQVLRTGDGRSSSDYRITVTGPEGRQSEAPQSAPPGPADRAPRVGNPRPQGRQDAAPIIPSLSVPAPPSPVDTASDGGELFHVEHPEPPDNPAARVLAAGEKIPPYEFDDWYRAYPLHKGRGQAEKAYAAARRKATADQLLEGAQRYGADPDRDPKFTAHPTTWLNGQRWLDEVAAPVVAPESGWDRAEASGTVSEEEL
jgi:hypothetical protein